VGLSEFGLAPGVGRGVLLAAARLLNMVVMRPKVHTGRCLRSGVEAVVRVKKALSRSGMTMNLGIKITRVIASRFGVFGVRRGPIQYELREGQLLANVFMREGRHFRIGILQTT
jgi:hypothetical protein